MSELLLARLQMAFSLGFHIIFASISMVMPFLMFAARRRHLRDGNPVDLQLTKAWMKGTAILFATGAVSGTVLSFQLGLLWPGFMEIAGPVIGLPFALEGAAFFLEAIFLGLFLYGWGRLPPRWHLACGFMVGVCGVASGVLVLSASGWMNAPTGFRLVDGVAVDIDPWAALFNDGWGWKALHMTLAAFQATSVAALGLHAWGLRRGRADALHRRAMRYLVPVFVVTSLAQPIVGDLSARWVAQNQPAKFAAMEAHFETRTYAPLHIGGWPDEDAGTVDLSLEIPGALSWLAHGEVSAEVLGLDAFPPEDRPPVLLPHLAFQTMVGIGTLLLALALVWIVGGWRGWRLVDRMRWQRLLMLLTPVGFIALEAGWIVTEVGRQPWVIHGMLRTEDAVTPVTGLGWSFGLMGVVYALLGTISFWLLWRWFRKAEADTAAEDGDA